MRPAGGNHQTLRRNIERWGLDTAHFDPAACRTRGGRTPTPLEDILVPHSTFARGHLKERLYAAGLKTPQCELCGQGRSWRGREMALVLDHVNGVADDNRLENLRIVCPNCAATLSTHCGRNTASPPAQACAGCRRPFRPRRRRQRYCSVTCARAASAGVPRPATRTAERPTHERLLVEVARDGYRGTGQRHGVSDTAVRKWLAFYERAAARPGKNG